MAYFHSMEPAGYELVVIAPLMAASSTVMLTPESMNGIPASESAS